MQFHVWYVLTENHRKSIFLRRAGLNIRRALRTSQLWARLKISDVAENATFMGCCFRLFLIHRNRSRRLQLYCNQGTEFRTSEYNSHIQYDDMGSFGLNRVSNFCLKPKLNLNSKSGFNTEFRTRYKTLFYISYVATDV